MRHRKLFGVLLCLLLVRAAAAAPAITLDGGDALPFTLVDNRIFVAVTVNGRGPYQFIFDSGGSNILDLGTARELGLALEGDDPAAGAGATTQQAWRTQVDDAALGPVRMRAQDFMVLSLDAIRRAIGFRRLDGVVGRELFERFVIDIDYRTSKLSFIERSRWTPSPSWKNALPLTFIGSIPAIQGAVDGIAGTFVIDTGDRSSLTLFGPFVERYGLRARHPRKVRAITGWGVGGPIPADVTRVGKLAFGEFAVEGVVTRMPVLKTGAFAMTEAAGSFGTGVLKRFHVTFDYAAKRMLFTPNDVYRAPDPADRSGLWLSLRDNGFEVMSVVDGGPAAEGGVQVGDLVTAVDGVPAAQIFLVELRERLKTSAPSTVVRLKLKTAAGLREVELTLRDLI